MAARHLHAKSPGQRENGDAPPGPYANYQNHRRNRFRIRTAPAAPAAAAAAAAGPKFFQGPANLHIKRGASDNTHTHTHTHKNSIRICITTTTTGDSGETMAPFEYRIGVAVSGPIDESGGRFGFFVLPHTFFFCFPTLFRPKRNETNGHRFHVCCCCCCCCCC